MIHALRLVRTKSPTLTLAPPTLQLPANLGKKASGVRFRQAATQSTQPETQSTQPESEQNMEDKAHNPKHQTGEAMSHSFGEGYSSRCDEEGFGGVYGGNQSFPKKGEHDQLIHENHPDYDKTQGSEVKEKETSRHQTNASS